MNLASYAAKDLGINRAVLNKIIIDRELEFYPEMTDICLVYYSFVVKMGKTVSVGLLRKIDGVDENTVITIGDKTGTVDGVKRIGVENYTSLC